MDRRGRKFINRAIKLATYVRFDLVPTILRHKVAEYGEEEVKEFQVL